MEKIKVELKSMQSNPRLYLANYFRDLKRDVDLAFNQEDKLKEKAKYLEIINKIEEIEQDYYKKTCKPWNSFDQEIESLVEQDQQSIDDLKYKIEEKLFQNKSILFIKDYGEEKKTFLLIVTNAYLRQITFNNWYELEYFNRESLIAYLIKTVKQYKNIEEFDAVNGLSSLKKIGIGYNQRNKQITKIHSSTFNGLTNLEDIYFWRNKIEELDPTIFNGLSSLKKIDFEDNQITKIHPSIFNGLTNLEEIYFKLNKIEELDPTIFNGLSSLKIIRFDWNKITKIHPSIFNGLTNLELIHFDGNKIEELDPTIFNGLSNLKRIYFKYNQITKIHPSTFNGLTNLERISLNNNKIEELDPNTVNFSKIRLYQ